MNQMELALLKYKWKRYGKPRFFAVNVLRYSQMFWKSINIPRQYLRKQRKDRSFEPILKTIFYLLKMDLNCKSIAIFQGKL